MAWRSFLSVGRKASNANLLVASPDMVSAVIHAAASGTAVTSDSGLLAHMH